ncbi:MAG: right-handed parallel beta-helix repeat-containing protein [Patescibacteria group bacterium]
MTRLATKTKLREKTAVAYIILTATVSAAALIAAVFVIFRVNSVDIEPAPARSVVSCGSVITTDTFLTADLLDCTGNGIEIGADDIILDCQDHLITGPGKSTNYTGIEINRRSGVKIRGCNVYNFGKGFDVHGVFGQPSTNNILINNVAFNNNFGIYIKESFGNGLYRNVASNNNHGIYIGYYTQDNILENNIVNGNNQYGIKLYNSDGNKFIANTANWNGENLSGDKDFWCEGGVDNQWEDNLCKGITDCSGLTCYQYGQFDSTGINNNLVFNPGFEMDYSINYQGCYGGCDRGFGNHKPDGWIWDDIEDNFDYIENGAGCFNERCIKLNSVDDEWIGVGQVFEVEPAESYTLVAYMKYEGDGTDTAYMHIYECAEWEGDSCVSGAGWTTEKVYGNSSDWERVEIDFQLDPTTNYVRVWAGIYDDPGNYVWLDNLQFSKNGDLDQYTIMDTHGLQTIGEQVLVRQHAIFNPDDPANPTPVNYQWLAEGQWGQGWAEISRVVLSEDNEIGEFKVNPLNDMCLNQSGLKCEPIAANNYCQALGYGEYLDGTMACDGEQHLMGNWANSDIDPLHFNCGSGGSDEWIESMSCFKATPPPEYYNQDHFDTYFSLMDAEFSFCGDGVITETAEECEADADCATGEECWYCKCVSKHEPNDTNCSSNSENGEYLLHGNDTKWSCQLMTVKSNEEINFLDYIVDDAIDCCITPQGIVSNNHRELCDFVHSEYGFLTSRDCVTRFIGTGLSDTHNSVSNFGNKTPWIQNYYYPELCCYAGKDRGDQLCSDGGGTPGICSPDQVNGIAYNDYVLGLDCSDYDCNFHDQSALKSSTILNSGTCVDWSLLTTTLLRKAGRHYANPGEGDLILSADEDGHFANLVWVDEVGTWVFMDYGRLYFDPENAWWDYCDKIEGCGHENQWLGCTRSWASDNVYGCD